MSEMFINDRDAYSTWGVRMGEGFLDAIDAFVPMKEYIVSSSRSENGKRFITENAKVDSRDVTLCFTIEGDTESDYRLKRKAFEKELQTGEIHIKIPKLGADVYKLVYNGKSISYAMNTARTFCKFSIKFIEPNPADRK